MWKNGPFSGRIWPDWGNTAWADMAGLGLKGLKLNGGKKGKVRTIFKSVWAPERK